MNMVIRPAQVINREYWFSAAHRLEGHPKCGRLHGHNYKVIIEVTTDESWVDRYGWAVDFGELDTMVKPIIDGELDHRYLVSHENVGKDPYALIAIQMDHAATLPIERSTAEAIAAYIADMVGEVVRDKYGLDGPYISSVTVWETPRSSAVWHAHKRD